MAVVSNSLRDPDKMAVVSNSLRDPDNKMLAVVSNSLRDLMIRWRQLAIA
jgi:hypothetical protein